MIHSPVVCAQAGTQYNAESVNNADAMIVLRSAVIILSPNTVAYIPRRTFLIHAAREQAALNGKRRQRTAKAGETVAASLE
jgi:hypothetical protein